MGARVADKDMASLSDAIEALRDDLAKAWFDGQDSRVRFKVEPVELTVQVGITKTGEGSAGIKWHILTLGGTRRHESVTTQTLKLRLQPVFYDEHGRHLSPLVLDREGDAGPPAGGGSTGSGGSLNDPE
jgi:hypothetical protein